MRQKTPPAALTAASLRARIQADPDVQGARKLLESLEGKRERAQIELDRLVARHPERSRADLLDDLMAGRELDLAPGPRAALDEAHRGADLLRSAVLVAEGRVREVEGKVRKRLARELRGEFGERWGRVADGLVAVRELVGELVEAYDAADAAGISTSYFQMAIPIQSFNLRNPESKLNHWVSEIEREYGITISRPDRRGGGRAA